MTYTLSVDIMTLNHCKKLAPKNAVKDD